MYVICDQIFLALLVIVFPGMAENFLLTSLSITYQLGYKNAGSSSGSSEGTCIVVPSVVSSREFLDDIAYMQIYCVLICYQAGVKFISRALNTTSDR
jgi:hypothetical protein